MIMPFATDRKGALKFDPDDLIKTQQNGSSLPNRERGVKERRQKKNMMWN